MIYESRGNILEYNDKKHQYILNNEIIPGSSTFIKEGYPLAFGLRDWMIGEGAKYVLNWAKKKLLSNTKQKGPTLQQQYEIIKEAKKAPQKQAQKAATIGTFLHEYAYLYCKGFHDESEQLIQTYKEHLDYKSMMHCVDLFIDWVADTNLEVLELEGCCASIVHKFGGTFDNLSKLGGKITLIDYKTGKLFYVGQLLQLAAYSIAIKEWYDIDIEELRVVRFGKTDKKYMELVISSSQEIKELQDQALVCLQTYRFDKKWGKDRRIRNW